MQLSYYFTILKEYKKRYYPVLGKLLKYNH